MKKFNDGFSDFLIIGAVIMGTILLMRACDVAEEAVKSFRYEQPSKSAPP
jgi:hypothetical protein